MAANPPSANVCSGSLLSFVAGVSPQSRQDALNATLLAQLASNRKFNREEKTVEWYGFYRNVLENVGWVIQDFDFGKVHAASNTFSMDKVVLDLIAAIASNDEISVLDTAIEALKALENHDGRLVLFESQTHSASKENFQIGVANETGGVLSLKIAAAYFSTTQNVTNVLWFSFGSAQTSVYAGAQGMILNADVYERVRKPIIEKLGDRAQDYVIDIEI